jgi:hypothetical protein
MQGASNPTDPAVTMSKPPSASPPRRKAKNAAASAAVGASKGGRGKGVGVVSAAAAAGADAVGGERAMAVVAATRMDGLAGGVVRPVWMNPSGGLTMIDTRKGGLNYYRMDVRQQSSICRRMAERNWFLAPVLSLRHAAWVEDFAVVDENGESQEAEYNFYDLASDILWESLISSNVVCLWRKGEKLPIVSVLDAEAVEYSAGGGIERVVIQYSRDDLMAKDKAREAEYRKILGDKMYEARVNGKKLTLLKGSEEDEWDFEVMVSGKRRGVFKIPEMVPILDTVDYMELIGVGDWNLAWFRKDVIRVIKKGYKVAHGPGSGINSVDITPKDIQDLGEAFAGVNGAATMPANHDVDPGYLTMDSAAFDPKTVAAALDRLLLFGGIEAVVLFDSFSQQNGAAPSLMRNARAKAFSRRREVENLLRRIFRADEFRSLDFESGKNRFHWGVKSLYSVGELIEMVKGLGHGLASPQTLRAMFGLDDALESARMLAAHKNREAYAPPFEQGQNLLPSIFPELVQEGGGGASPPGSAPGDPGRPPQNAE